MWEYYTKSNIKKIKEPFHDKFKRVLQYHIATMYFYSDSKAVRGVVRTFRIVCAEKGG